METLSKYKLEIIVFFSGAIVMILEIIGSRVLAPYIGTSIYVWTGLISVVMGSLSFGYYYGGRLADKKANLKNLSVILLASGISVLITAVVKNILLFIIQQGMADPKFSSIWASLMLFGIPSFLLGMVSPYSVKLKMKDLDVSGKTVGDLYALSTAGSIFGTVFAGFFLISLMGTTNILFVLAASLIFLSLYCNLKFSLPHKILGLVFVALGFSLFRYFHAMELKDNFFDLDTKYNRVWIYDDLDPISKKTIRRMNLGTQFASAMFTDSSDLVYNYAKYYNLIPYFTGEIKNGLVLGGAAYTYPREFMRLYPSAKLDVVELDPDLVVLAKKYFGFKETDSFTNYPEDARTFLNTTNKKYDAIYVDVFNTSFSIPFHLTTLETVNRLYDSLSPNGAVAVNLISSLTGNGSKFFNSEITTYRKVFPRVHVFPVESSSKTDPQNIVFIAVKNPNTSIITPTNPADAALLKNMWEGKISDNGIILTDDFAPIESFYDSIH